jgi:hypothetical protein
MSGSKQEPRLAVLNLVGLCSRLLGKNTPKLNQFIEKHPDKLR